MKTTKKGRLKVKRRNTNIPTANDLVFLQKSPNYCHQNGTIGSMGTHGRVCLPNARYTYNILVPISNIVFRLNLNVFASTQA